MNSFIYHSYTRFIFGSGCENKAGELCRQFNATKVLIVVGGGSVKRSGLLDRVTASLDAAGLPYGLLEGIQPNPLDTKVREGIGMVRSEGYDFLLPVGGGSVIDTAKAICAGALYDGDFWDFYCGKATVTKALPLGVVLTIPAAGSEGSGNTVITDTKTLAKISIRVADYLRPKFSLLNPELTLTLPWAQTVAGIADMMAHIMERYFSNTEDTMVTDRMNEGLLMAIMETSSRLLKNPDDLQARANIMWAATQAHIGIGGVGVEEDWSSHALEHELSARYGVTHGTGLAVIFPAWISVVSAYNPRKAVQLSERVFGVDASLPDNEKIAEGVSRMKAFLRSLGLPVTLAELGIPDPDIDLLVEGLHRNKGEKVGFYVPLDRNLSRKIYEQAR